MPWTVVTAIILVTVGSPVRRLSRYPPYNSGMTAVTNHLVNGICCLVRPCILAFPRVPVVHAPFDKTAKLLVLVVDELVTLLVVVLVWVLKVATSPHHNQKRGERSDCTRFQGAALGYGHLISDCPHLEAPNLPMVCRFSRPCWSPACFQYRSPPKSPSSRCFEVSKTHVHIWQCVKTNSTPSVHIKIAGLTWMFIPLYIYIWYFHRYWSIAICCKSI